MYLRVGADGVGTTMLDPHTVDCEGNSALHFVVSIDFNEVAIWLIDKGFKFVLENNYGDTPYDIAVARKNYFLVRHMQKIYAVRR